MESRWMMFPSPVLDAAFSILADGKRRTYTEIFAEAQKRGLLDSKERAEYVLKALRGYVQRTAARNGNPAVVEDADHRFRLNRPIDDWPAIDTTGLTPLGSACEPVSEAAATLAALKAASAGTDADAFESAVCAAFSLFGFISTHVGGGGAPDGYADALLGELAYRVMIECKLQHPHAVSDSNAAAEAAKYRDVYHADFCALVAPSLNTQITFAQDLQTHRIAAWTIDDLSRAAALSLDCSQMRDLFAPGYASDSLDDLAWARLHGADKRLRVVASLLVEVGLAQQRMAHSLGTPAASPCLTAEVALSLIDDRLATAGSRHGATRDEIDAAFTWLTSPYVGHAIWTDNNRTAIVIRPRP